MLMRMRERMMMRMTPPQPYPLLAPQNLSPPQPPWMKMRMRERMLRERMMMKMTPPQPHPLLAPQNLSSPQPPWMRMRMRMRERERMRMTPPNSATKPQTLSFMSSVINALMSKMVTEKNEVGGKALFIDSFEMTRIWEGKGSRLKCDPTQHNLIMGAVHEPGHWILTVIFPKERRSIVVDPLGNDGRKVQQCLQSTRAFIRKKGCNVSRWTAGTVPHTPPCRGMATPAEPLS